MTTTKREKGLIVIQLSGGNDYLNTVVPYADGSYYDSRSTVHIPQDKVIPLNDQIGFNPSMGPMKTLWDEGKVAVINGIGYENPNRSHFRAMDIWHTAEPDAHRQRGLAGPRHPGHRPSGRERADGGQLRSRPSPCARVPRRFRSLRWATWRPTACSPTSKMKNCECSPSRPLPGCTAMWPGGTR